MNNDDWICFMVQAICFVGFVTMGLFVSPAFFLFAMFPLALGSFVLGYVSARELWRRS